MAPEADTARRRSIVVVVGVGMAVVALLVAGALAVLADSGEPEVVAEMRFDAVRTDASGRSLLLSFVGSQAGDGPCGSDYGARVDEEADRVVVGLGTVEDDRPELSDNETCRALGYPRTLLVDLTEPLAGRPVVDRVSGLAHRPFDAGDLLVPSRLPDGWEVQGEGGSTVPSSARYWTTSYGPADGGGAGVILSQGDPSLGEVDGLAYEVEEAVTIQGAQASVVHLRDGPAVARSVLWILEGVGVRVDSTHQQGQERLDTEVLVDFARSLE
jgi:hypothetical protein